MNANVKGVIFKRDGNKVTSPPNVTQNDVFGAAVCLFGSSSLLNIHNNVAMMMLQYRCFLLRQVRLLGRTSSSSYCSRNYFTNGDRLRQEDPYAVLGLQYGDGCTVTEIKTAFRQKAAQFHPDVHSCPQEKKKAAQQFQRVLQAYQTLTKIHTQLPGLDASKDFEWKTAVWRTADRIATNRTDVAGMAKRRPIAFVALQHQHQHRQYQYTLGHPQHGGVRRSGEYLGDIDITKPKIASSVGRGQSKWVTKPATYKPWNGNGGNSGNSDNNGNKR